MKLTCFCLALLVFLALPGSLRAEQAEVEASYAFELKSAKQRKNRDKNGNVTNELWNYKIEVENKSLADVGELDVKYTVYISTETQSGASRREATRSVNGKSTLDAIARGNSSEFLSDSLPLKQTTKVERSKSKKRSGSKKSGKTQTKVTEVTEKLDGIRLQLFLKGKKVGEYIVGDAAKRASLKGKKK